MLGGIFLVPFIAFLVADSYFFPFISGKNFAFRIVVEVIFTAWVGLMIIDPESRPRRSWVMTAIMAAVAALSLATVFGENPFKSFWSNSERMEGLISHFHYFAYFVVLITAVKKERTWYWLFHTSLLAATIMAIYAFVQLSGGAIINQGGVRLDGTFGNAIYLAVYMLFHIFIAGYYLLRERVENWQRLFYGVLIVAFAIIMYYTATRGVILGAIGGTLLTLLIISIGNGGRARKIAGGILGVMAVLIVAFILAKDTDFVRSSPVMKRFSNISFTETTTESRFIIWGMALKGVKEQPILGVGPGNFNLVFNKHYDPRLYRQEPWFDRAHNVILDWLSSAGILGLLAYLSIFFAALKHIWRDLKERWTTTNKAVVTGLLAGYFFQNLFAFDNLFSFILFFTILAYIHSEADEATPDLPENQPQAIGAGSFWRQPIPEFAQVVSGIAIVILMSITLYTWNIKPMSANQALISALSDKYTGVNEGTLEKMNKVFSYDTFINTEAGEQFILMTGQLARDQEVDNNLKLALAEKVRVEFEKQLEISPNDSRHQLFFGSFLRTYGQADRAIEHLEIALENAPRKQNIMSELGALYASIGDMEKALFYFESSFNLDPRFDQARIVYVASLLTDGQVEKAEALLTEGFGHANVRDNLIITSYANLGMYDRVVEIWEYTINEALQNGESIPPTWYVSMGASYYATGQNENAINALLSAKEVNPGGAAEIDDLIYRIRNGLPI